MRLAITIASLSCCLSIGATSALAAPDDCQASIAERNAFVGRIILQQLDRGEGVANHPSWLREIMIEPDRHNQRLADYCDATPDAKMETALERLYAPEAASK